MGKRDNLARKTSKTWWNNGSQIKNLRRIFMYLKRKIDVLLEERKENSEKRSLIIRGARQVGETEAIRHFVKKKL